MSEWLKTVSVIFVVYLAIVIFWVLRWIRNEAYERYGVGK